MNKPIRATIGAGIFASAFLLGACGSSTTEDDGTETETDTETTVAEDETTEETEAD